MKESQFKEYLLLHGARIEEWPAVERRAAEQLLYSKPALKARVEEEQRLEQLLALQAPPLNANFADRIIEKAVRLPQMKSYSFTEWLTSLFAEFQLQRPAYALAGMLVIGFLLGAVPSTDDVLFTLDSAADLDEDGVTL